MTKLLFFTLLAVLAGVCVAHESVSSMSPIVGDNIISKKLLSSAQNVPIPNLLQKTSTNVLNNPSEDSNIQKQDAEKSQKIDGLNINKDKLMVARNLLRFRKLLK